MEGIKYSRIHESSVAKGELKTLREKSSDFRRRIDERDKEGCTPGPYALELITLGPTDFITVHFLRNFRYLAIGTQSAPTQQSRATGAVLTLTGVVNLAMLRDRRWSAFRILYGAQLLSLAAIVVSLIVRRDDLLWDRPLTVPFLALVAAAALAYSAVTAWCELRLRRASAAA